MSSPKKKIVGTPDNIDNSALEGMDFFRDEHPRYTLDYWKSEVQYNLTRMGYWQWVKDNLQKDQPIAPT